MADRRTALHTILIVLIAFAVYLPSLRNGFAYDDVARIREDQRIHSLRNIPALFASGYWPEAQHAIYRPLTTTSYALDWALYAGRPWGFHLTNAIANALVVGLVFLLLLRLAPAPAAAAGALLFALHPVHVEAVANIVGRGEVFMAAFGLAAVLLWTGPRLRTKAVITLYALALLSKENAIMLPALLALADVAVGNLRVNTLREWWRKRQGAYAAFAAVALAYLAVRVAVLGSSTPTELEAAIEIARGDARLPTVLQIWPIVVRQLVFPRVLLADYGPRVLMPANGWPVASLVGALILTALILGGALAFRTGRARTTSVLLWVPIALLPASNLIVPIGVLFAERALYLPSLAIAMAATGAIASLHSTRVRWLPIAAALLLCTLGAARTLQRIPEWANTRTLFAAQLRDAPYSFRAHWFHARDAASHERVTEALASYRTALDLWPHRRTLVTEAAIFAALNGDYVFALHAARIALDQWPDDVYNRRILVAAALQLGDTTAARTALNNGLRHHPHDPELLRLHHSMRPRGNAAHSTHVPGSRSAQPPRSPRFRAPRLRGSA